MCSATMGGKGRGEERKSDVEWQGANCVVYICHEIRAEQRHWLKGGAFLQITRNYNVS